MLVGFAIPGGCRLVPSPAMETLDVAVVGLYVLSVLGLGLWTGREERNEEDYFLGGRAMPWGAVAVSFLATTMSALTFVAVPGDAFNGNFVYLQLALGDLIGRLLIYAYLIPAYFAANVTTVYQLLGKRFGPRSQDAGTVLFLVTRVLASGVRLAACAIAFSVIFEMPLDRTIVVIAAIATVYTVAGGIKAVIWTDTLQFALFMSGAVIALGWILVHLPEGFDTFWRVGNEHGKFQVLHLNWDFNDPKNFVPGTFFGMLLTFAVQGTDQDLVQRLLTTRTVGESQKAMLLTALLNVPLNLVFLSVGAALFVHYQVHPDAGVQALVAQGRADYVFPYFMKTVLPAGLRGLLMAGLLAAAMSSLDSALNALASTAYMDLYRKYTPWESTPEEAVRVSRGLSVAFAVALVLTAMVFGRQPGILWVGFRVMGYTYGTLLGLFLLAVWTDTRGSDTGNLIAIPVSIGLVLVLTAAPPYGTAALAWPWGIVVGTASTVLIGSLWATPAPRSAP